MPNNFFIDTSGWASIFIPTETHSPIAAEHFRTAIADLQTLIQDLQTQHPSVTRETQALAIIDAEFTEIKRHPTHKLATLRRQILNPERHAQAIKATAKSSNTTWKTAFGPKPA
jgi:hypothetical protein